MDWPTGPGRTDPADQEMQRGRCAQGETNRRDPVSPTLSDAPRAASSLSDFSKPGGLKKTEEKSNRGHGRPIRQRGPRIDGVAPALPPVRVGVPRPRRARGTAALAGPGGAGDRFRTGSDRRGTSPVCAFMGWQVVFSRRSEADLRKIVDFIASDNPAAAERFGLALVGSKRGQSLPIDIWGETGETGVCQGERGWSMRGRFIM